jgi:hypothetical protein
MLNINRRTVNDGAKYTFIPGKFSVKKGKLPILSGMCIEI